MVEQFADLRKEMKDQFKGTAEQFAGHQKETAEQFADLRKGMADQFKGMEEQFTDLRKEMKDRFKETGERFTNLEGRLGSIETDTGYLVSKVARLEKIVR